MTIGKYLLVLTLALAIVLAFLVAALPANADFASANPGWNGTSELQEATRATLVASPHDIAEPGRAVLLCFPEQAFSPRELDALQRYVRQGGTLLLADDFGHGNELLAALGLATRFAGVPLLDPVICYKDRAFPRIVRLADDPATSGVAVLVLNHATALTGAPAGSVLAESSSFSFLDQNGNGTLDASEPAGPFPVLARERLGAGEVLILSDPSLFINGTFSLADNARLVSNIQSLPGGKLYLDESHLRLTSRTASQGKLSELCAILRQPPVTAATVLVTVILATLLVWPRGQRRE